MKLSAMIVGVVLMPILPCQGVSQNAAGHGRTRAWEDASAVRLLDPAGGTTTPASAAQGIAVENPQYEVAAEKDGRVARGRCTLSKGGHTVRLVLDTTAAAGGIRLGNGTEAVAVAVAPGATPREQLAAQVIVDYLARISGKRLPPQEKTARSCRRSPTWFSPREPPRFGPATIYSASTV